MAAGQTRMKLAVDASLTPGPSPLFRTAIVLIFLLSGCAGAKPQQPILATVRSGRLEWAGDLPVLHLYGSSYEMGYQHGSLLREQVRASVDKLLAFADAELGIPLAGKLFARRKLDAAWRQMERFVPPQYLEEMEGLADGAGIPLRLLKRAHAVPELTSPGGANFVAAGAATPDGRLVHTFNLDWAIKSGIQEYAALIVRHPARGRASVSAGWLGSVGVLSGINEDEISVAGVGAETADKDPKGIPMPFLLRLVLEESSDLEKAVSLVRNSPRTAGCNYLFADAKAKRAVTLETTRSRCAVSWMGQETGALGVPAEVSPGSLQSVVFTYPEMYVANARGREPAAKGGYQKVDLRELFGGAP